MSEQAFTPLFLLVVSIEIVTAPQLKLLLLKVD